jgi:hypothetical protein
MPDIAAAHLGLTVPNFLPDWHFLRPAGRLIWASLILIAGVAIAFIWTRIPKKSAEPATWAQTILGGMAVFALMILAYGTVPHEWLNFGSSYLQFGKDTYVVQQGQWIGNLPPFDITRAVVVDAVAAGMYVVFATINIYLFAAWQKRPVAEPATEGEAEAAAPAGRLARLRRRSKGVSAYGRPVTTSE